MSAEAPAGGGARRGIESILEEESLGKAVDRRLLARLWPFISPYRAQVAATILLVIPMFALELLPAWIVKTGLDAVILKTPTSAGALGGLLAPPAGWAPLPWLGDPLPRRRARPHGALLRAHGADGDDRPGRDARPPRRRLPAHREPPPRLLRLAIRSAAS